MDIVAHLDRLEEIGYFEQYRPFHKIVRNYMERFYNEGKITVDDLPTEI